MARKTHCLFIEEENYNWSSPRSAMYRRLLSISLFLLVAGLFINALS